jgi:hypothetical protein
MLTGVNNQCATVTFAIGEGLLAGSSGNFAGPNGSKADAPTADQTGPK